MLHSEILCAWHFNTKQHLLPVIGGLSNIEMYVQQFSIMTTNLMVYGKLAEQSFNVSLFSNSGEKVLKSIKIMGQICHIVFLLFRTFSLQLENNIAMKCNIYMVIMENSLNFISPPNTGRRSKIVLKCHALRISECNI